MFANFIAWTTQLNAASPLLFAIVTVAVMAVVGVFFAALMELVFKAIGVRAGRPDGLHR